MMDRLGPGAYLGPDSQGITIVGSKLSVLRGGPLDILEGGGVEKFPLQEFFFLVGSRGVARLLILGGRREVLTTPEKN